MQIINKKFIAILGAITAAIVVVYSFFLLYTFDLNDTHREKIKNQIKNQTNLDLSPAFSGIIKVLPTPELVIEEVSLSDEKEMMARADRVKVKLKFSEFIKVITEGELDLNDLRIRIIDGELDLGILAEYINKKGLQLEKIIDTTKIELQNITLASSQYNSYWNDWKLTKGNITLDPKGASFTSNIQHNKISANLNLEAAKNNQGLCINRFSYSSEGFNLTFGDDPENIGDIAQTKFIQNGQIKLEVVDLVKTINHLNQVIDSNDTSFDFSRYFGSTGNSIIVTAKINTENGRKIIHNFRTESDQERLNIPGKISFTHLFDNTILDAKMEIDEIDMQHMLTLKENNKNIYYDAIIKATKYFDLNLDKNLKFLIDVTIKKIKLLNDEIANTELVAVGTEGVYILDNLSFSNAAGTKVKMNGIATDGIIPRFQGKLEFLNDKSEMVLEDLGLYQGSQKNNEQNNNRNQDLNPITTDQYNTTPGTLSLDLILAPARLSIKNINGKFANNSAINGEFTMIIDRDDITKMNGELNLKGIDLQKTTTSPQLYNYILKLYTADSDQTGDLYFKLTDDHSWLRYLNSRWNLKLNLANSTFDQIKLDNSSMLLQVEPGHLNFINLKINSSILEGDLNLKLDLKNLKPYFQISGKIDRLDLPLLLKTLPNNLELQESIKKNPDLKNIYLANQEAFARELNLFSANHYNMNIDLELANVNLSDNINIAKSEFEGVLYEGVVGVNNFNGKILDGGNFTAKSRFVISTPIPQYTVVASLANFNLQTLLAPITGLTDLSGYVSISGILNSSGSSSTSIKQKLNGSIKYIGKQFVYKGLDIDATIAGIDDSSLSGIQKLQAINKNLTTGQTYIDDIKGSITIKNGILTSADTQFFNNRMSGTYSANYNAWSNDVNAATMFFFKPINNQNNTLKIGINIAGRLPKNYKSDYNLDELISYIKRTSPDDTIPQSVMNNKSVRDRAVNY